MTWTYHPTRWDNEFFHILFAYDWELMESPAGAKQWRPKHGAGLDMVPGAFEGAPSREPRMLTSDIALRVDPVYEKIARRFLEHPDEFQLAFAKAWYKLLHRDMGPVSRYLGPWVPEAQPWQDPVPAVDHELVSTTTAALKTKLLESGLSTQQLVLTAWAAAASYRGTDMRGGANGARIRLEPQRSWEVNQPAELANVLEILGRVQGEFNDSQRGGKKVSLADLIVLGGCAAVEQAARNADHDITVPFTPGRTDASQEQTDVESFSVLQPKADGFPQLPARGREAAAGDVAARPVQRAAPDGARDDCPRRRDARAGRQRRRDVPRRPHRSPGTLTNDFFVNLLDMGTEWEDLGDDGEPLRRP